MDNQLKPTPNESSLERDQRIRKTKEAIQETLRLGDAIRYTSRGFEVECPRDVVRDALTELVSDGLLDFRPGLGYRVPGTFPAAVLRFIARFKR